MVTGFSPRRCLGESWTRYNATARVLPISCQRHAVSRRRAVAARPVTLATAWDHQPETDAAGTGAELITTGCQCNAPFSPAWAKYRTLRAMFPPLAHAV